MQQNVILQRIQTHHQIRLQRLPLRNLIIIPLKRLIEHIHRSNPTLRKDLIAVRDGARYPLLEQMAPLRHLRSVDDGWTLSRPCPYEEDQSAVIGNTFYDFSCTPEMCGCSLERDDMHALPDAKNISLIHRIPETRSMAQMRLASHQ